MYSENAPAVFGNQTVLSNLPGEFYSMESNEIQNDCKYRFFMIQAAQNQKQTNTGGLGKLLLLKIDAKAVLSSVQIFKIT